jgi:GNAT-family acetyltransferase (TIGR03103 family)
LPEVFWILGSSKSSSVAFQKGLAEIDEEEKKRFYNKAKPDVCIEMGWGNLIFANTFRDASKLAKAVCDEREGQRHIAMYTENPHVVISKAPQEIFLDPSHTYRLWLDGFIAEKTSHPGFFIRKLKSKNDVVQSNAIYSARHMMPSDEKTVLKEKNSKTVFRFVAVDREKNNVIGVLTAVDHKTAFHDPQNGASFWSLAVDPSVSTPGVGEAMVREIAGHFKGLGRKYLDLSVMYYNKEAIQLYKKLGFKRVQLFALKHKNPINEPLFVSPAPIKKLNPYAQILINEAKKRGIKVKVIDVKDAYFSLSYGGTTIECRESLSELTSAVAMSLCSDKSTTFRVLKKERIVVPEQTVAGSKSQNKKFLSKFRRIVVKPAVGEAGKGVFVDIRSPKELERAVVQAKKMNEKVLLEEMIEGQDLRIIVIDYKFVAAATRRAPSISGTGKHTVLQLIKKLNRKRMAATEGESRVPIDDETKRYVKAAGYSFGSVLPAGKTIVVRKTANLHTGGTIHDVTSIVCPEIRRIAVKTARALKTPVLGVDLIMPKLEGKKYHFIEANERPGLANHEPQPTAERFVDLLFPQTRGIIKRRI